MASGGGGSSRTKAQMLHVVINPASGDCSAKDTWQNLVKPLIDEHAPGCSVSTHYTSSEGDGERIGRDIASKAAATSETLRIVCLGGDGTTHEVLNGLVARCDDGTFQAPSVELAVVPTGTANALYASLYAKECGSEHIYDDRLRSLRALLAGAGSSLPLALSAVTLDKAEADEQSATASSSRMAHLITSHALHAAILADSEALRGEQPGIERFKMAAAQNATKWTEASVELLPTKNDKVKQYSPRDGGFRAVEGDGNDGQGGELHLAGPILYFACVTTDRLEPAFVPAPLSGTLCEQSHLQRHADETDVVIIRPMRQGISSSSPATQADRETFAKNVLQRVTADMYNEGKHIDLTYAADGSIEVKGQGSPVCEYYRCAGYRWQPADKDAQRTCIDGSIVNAQRTGVRALRDDEGAGLIRVCR